MAYNLEISYFNSFWVKKTNNQWTESQYGSAGHGNLSLIHI